MGSERLGKALKQCQIRVRINLVPPTRPRKMGASAMVNRLHLPALDGWQSGDVIDSDVVPGGSEAWACLRWF